MTAVSSSSLVGKWRCTVPAPSPARPGSTILRLTYGLDAVLARDVRSAIATGVLTAPAGSAATAPATNDELAEATANVLAGSDHGGRVYELTGPDAITWHDLAALATAIAGREIAYRPVAEAEFRDQVVASGFPPAAVDNLLALYAAFRSGWTGTPGGDLSRLLRRSPTAALEAVRSVVEAAA